MSQKISPRVHVAGILQWQAYRVLEQGIDQALSPFILSAPEWKFLGVVSEFPETSPLAVAKILGVKAPLISRITQSLETKKMITIFSSKKDGRGKHIKLSTKGEKVFAEASEAVQEIMRVLLSGAERKELDHYKKVLEVIVNNRETLA